jgi:hypothetical protein
MRKGFLIAVFGLCVYGCTVNDIESPVVEIVYPVNWSVLPMGNIEVKTAVWDNEAIDRVDFYVDGDSTASVSSAPYAMTWTPASLGEHSIYAWAHDEQGNSQMSDAVFVTIANTTDTVAPTVSLTYPAHWAIVKDTVTIRAEASDNVDVASVTFFVNGDSLLTDVLAPYEAPWNTHQFTDDNHTIYAKAADAAGNKGASSVITVTVDNSK